MRLFKVKSTGEFAEYKEQVFKSKHTEQTLEAWLENNSDSIVEDGALLIIGRQVATNLSSFVDLLALDRRGNTAIVELKRGKTPRETIAQALEYASWAEGLEYANLEQILRDYLKDENLSLSEYHKSFFKLEATQGVSFNKDQRIVIVGYKISQEIRQTALFLRKKGLQATCVEFNYFKADPKEQLMLVEIVVGKEPLKNERIKTETRPATTKKKFLADLDAEALPVFEAVLDMAERQKLPIHWGAVGFSLNVDINDIHMALLMGYPKSSAYSQTIYTYYSAIIKRIADGEGLFESFKDKLTKTGLFEKAGNEMKYVIRQKPTEEQTEDLLNLILEFAGQIKEKGLIE